MAKLFSVSYNKVKNQNNMKKLYILILSIITFIGFSQEQITPLANTCAMNGFNLTLKNTELLAGQSLNNVTLTFFESLMNAQNQTFVIQNPTTYQSFNNPNNLIFVRLFNTVTSIVSYKYFILQPVPLLTSGVQVFNTSSIIVSASGGKPPYMYSFNNSPFQASGSFTLNQPGNYIAAVRDANACTSLTTGNIGGNIMIANNDFFTVNNTVGAASTNISVVDNDTYDGSPVGPLYSLPNSPLPAGITMNAVGIITVASTVQSGTYTFTYSICSILLGISNTCSSAIVTLIVNTPSVINAVDDDFSADFFVTQTGGLTSPILNNDTLNGLPFTTLPPISLGLVKLNGNPVPTTQVIFSVNNLGQVTVPENLQAGVWTVQYTICQWLNPQSNCDSATVTIVVKDILEFNINSTYQDLNADGITNIGDKINYQLTVKNNGSLPITNVTIGVNAAISAPDNLMVVGNSVPSLAAGQSNSTNFTSSHLLTPTNIGANLVTKHATAKGTYNNTNISVNKSHTTQLLLSTGAKLQAFLDINNNGIKENTEPFFTNGNFNISLNTVQSTITSSTGLYYVYQSNPAVLYNLSYSVTGEYSAQYTSLAVFNNINIPANSGITTYNFPITSIPFSDLKVTVIPNGLPPRPGFSYKNFVLITNSGNTTIEAGTLTFTNNNVVSIVSTTPATTATATGFTYNYPSMAPQTTIFIEVKMLVPTIPIVSLGQNLTNSANISVPINDVNVNNNSNALTQTIVGSYDPNDKNEARGSKVLFAGFTANDYLTYTIQFENTGTFMAENVRIEDVLDTKLDETSVRMVSASHNYNLIRENNKLTWRFDGIGLPPSVVNTNIGHGFITFQIKPKTGFVLNDVISNLANIYFDFNPAIVTNTFTTTFVETLSNDRFESNNFSVYPNPTLSVLYLSNKNQNAEINAIEIFDLLGKKLLSQKQSTNTIDVSGLQNGIYLLTIKTNNTVESMKFIKQ